MNLDNFRTLQRVENYDPGTASSLTVNLDHIQYMYKGNCKGVPIIWLSLHSRKVMVLENDLLRRLLGG